MGKTHNHLMQPVLQPASPDMSSFTVPLIYLTMNEMADYLFGSDNAQNAQKLIKNLFQAKSNRFSYQFTEIVTVAEKPVGLVIAYSGKLMKSLKLPMALHLIRLRGILGFLNFIQRSFSMIGIKEAESDEYFISNIVVLPDYQGKGLGKYLLAQVEKQAIAQGLDKISLTVDVDNERAFSLYKQTGYKVIEVVEIESLRKRLGYTGFYRMQKILS